MRKIPVIIIQGPTAVGKSSFALKLAEELDTEIISADSRQVYKFLDIGTAKPSQQEQKNIKHHLIDIIDPKESYSAGCFVKDTNKIIPELHKAKKIPIIAGGTGFYISALIEGIFPAPEIPKEIRKELRKEVQKKGSHFFWNKLKQIDPESARRIEPADGQRLIRAYEVYLATGKSISQHWQESPQNNSNIIPLNILITEDRDRLYERINQRVDKMLQMGLLSELKQLLGIGYSSCDPGLNTVGYKELLAYLNGIDDFEEAIRKIKRNTRHYAKRQFTWYRKLDFDLTLRATNITFSQVLKRIEQFKKNKWSCDDNC